jgi:glycosyltransferase involved in cell wall biosynthesis
VTVPQLSIVIASFDSAPWLPSTIGSLTSALARSGVEAEIVVVDDGSTDDTGTVLGTLAAESSVPIRVIAQENRGRFLARFAGVQAARSERVLLFDSRLLIDEDAFANLERVDALRPDARAWIGHVPTDPAAPLVGRFWEVPTHVFWGGYLAHPVPTDITPANFDRVPKGTGCLVIDREAFLEACRAAWPEENADLVSDDTRLLRHVAEHGALRFDPGFRALYRPRVTVRGFLRHAFVRGTLFVDSYAGTGLVRNLVLLALVVAPVLALLVIVLAAVFGLWWLIVLIVALAVAGAVALALVAAARAAAERAILSFATYVIPFGAVFWAGLARGVWVHRRAFGSSRVRPAPDAAPRA